MRKIFLTLALAAAATSMAQVLEVASVERIDIVGTNATVVAGISPKGDYILLTGAQLNGLAKYDLASKKVEVLSKALGAGYNPAISDSGDAVAYREDRFENGLRSTDVTVKNFATGESKSLAKGVRNFNAVSIEGNTAVTVTDGRQVKTAIGNRRTTRAKQATVSIVNRQLVLSVDGKNTILTPNGTDKSYLWPTLSPDKTKVCYYVGGDGCYVCNLNGKIVARLGALRAAKWYDNNVVVGMHDTDDGHVITSSEIVAATLDGKRQVLTDPSVKAMYPYTGAEARKIVFGTDEGETYIINLK